MSKTAPSDSIFVDSDFNFQIQIETKESLQLSKSRSFWKNYTWKKIHRWQIRESHSDRTPKMKCRRCGGHSLVFVIFQTEIFDYSPSFLNRKWSEWKILDISYHALVKYSGKKTFRLIVNQSENADVYSVVSTDFQAQFSASIISILKY